MEKSKFSSPSPIAILLIFYFVISLIGITNPPLEIGHNWRQTVTAMMARNFYTHQTSFLFPEVDMTGNKSGIIGAEFPLFPQIIAYCDQIFGFQHWYGRLINLIISSFGAMAFYATIKQIFDKKIALYATGILLFSVWFSFARKIMPDTLSISFALIGNYYLLNALYPHQKFKNTDHNPTSQPEKPSAITEPATIRPLNHPPLWRRLFGFMLFVSLAILIKLPALLWLTPAACIILLSKQPPTKKLILAAASFTTLIPGYIWYYYWVPKLNQHFQLFYPKTLSQGLQEFLPFWNLALEKFYFTAFYSFIALIFLIFGIFIIALKINKKYLLTAVAFSIVFLIFILKTGSVFPQHNYYIIPFVPLMAITAALGISQISYPKKPSLSPKLQSIFLLLIMAEALLNQQHELFIKPTELYKMDLEKLSSQIPPKKLIISNAGINPQEIYFINRRGWVVFPTQLNKPYFIDSLYQCGASYLLVNKNIQNSDPLYFNDTTNSKLPNNHLIFSQIHDSKDYSIYTISSSRNPN